MPRVYKRRTFLQLVAAGGAAASLPWIPGCGDARGGGTVTEAHFFTPEERELIESLASAIVPEDQTVGAIGTNAVEYIDRFLAAFDNPEPTIYRSGPFSGRTPFPDPMTGEPTDNFPDDDFLEFLPLSRMQELAFRIMLDGSDSVPNGNINAPIVPPFPGLRSIYKDGIAALEAAAAGRPFTQLTDDEKLGAFGTTSNNFQEALLTHIAEGMFCAPEYGGNKDGVGWRDYFYDGDSQPLGHTLYNRETQTLFDRPDQPNQTLDPRLPNNGFTPDVESFVAAITLAQGGKRFF
jgi:hypothetical protein